MIDLSLPNLYNRIKKLEDRLATAEVWRGPYIAGRVYVPNEVVMYNGDVYIATSQNFNTLPTDATKWLLLTNNQSPVNYAFNGEFDMTSANGPLAASTVYTGVAPGWGQSISAGGTTANITLLDPGDDAPGGSKMAAVMGRSAGTADHILYQFPVPRVTYALTLRTFTISARVWCTHVGIAFIRYYNGSVWAVGAANTVASEWTTISLTVSAAALANTIAWGVLLSSTTAAETVYVNDFHVSEGTSVPTRLPFRPPTNAGNLMAGAGQARAPICVKIATVNTTVTAAGGAATIPFSTAEYDTDGMASGNGFICRTPGRYAIMSMVLVDNTTVPGNFYYYPARAGGALWRTVNAFVLTSTPPNNWSYTTADFCVIEDLIEGDAITAIAVSSIGGGSDRILAADSYLAAYWLGD